MNYELSIIIAFDDAAYNREKLKKTIDSVTAQNKENVETIICCDCPSEDAKNLLAKYESEKIKVLYTSERRGRGGAFNLGLRNTDAEWLCFLNCGDCISADFAEKMLGKAKESGADIVACGSDDDTNEADFEIFNEAKDSEEEYEKYALLTVNPGRMESKIYKRSIFDTNGLWFPENLLFEKMGIKRLALLCSTNFDFIEDVLFFADKEEKVVFEEELYDRLDVMSFFIEECFKREFLEEYPEEVEAACIDDMYLQTLFTYVSITPPRSRKQSFLKMLREAVLDCFPEFETNPYYYEKYDDEIKDLVSLHMASPYKLIKALMKVEEIWV